MQCAPLGRSNTARTEQLSRDYRAIFKHVFTLDKVARPRRRLCLTCTAISPQPNDDWKGARGYVTPDMIRENLPAPADDTLIIFCGARARAGSQKWHGQANGHVFALCLQVPRPWWRRL